MLEIDPKLFAPEAVSAETAAFNAKISETLAALPQTHEVPVELSRQARDEGKGAFPSGGPLPEGSDWATIPGGGRVRVSLPDGAPRGTFVHFHGGGWMLGRPSQYDSQNQALAKATGLAVVSVEYRLAPENPWPAGPDDCHAGAVWVLEHAPYGDGPVVFGGESAGAHLVAVVLLRLRAEGRLGRVRGAILNYGCYDLRLTGAARNWGNRPLVLSTPVMEFFTRGFVPDPAVRDSPEGSPILADLAGLPPALFQVGTEDPLMDDSLMMATLWARSGAGAELEVHPGGIHAFNMFEELEIAKRFRARSAEFVNAVTGA